jgi:hypothetical protein
MFARDDETAELLRRSTAMKTAGDWPAALEALAAAKARMVESPVHYPIDTWCKYARYLQQAGRFEAALQELDWLLADLPRRARKESFMDDPAVSFGRSTSKQSVYNATVRHGKKVIAEWRAKLEQREKKRLNRMGAAA